MNNRLCLPFLQEELAMSIWANNDFEPSIIDPVNLKQNVENLEAKSE